MKFLRVLRKVFKQRCLSIFFFFMCSTLLFIYTTRQSSERSLYAIYSLMNGRPHLQVTTVRPEGDLYTSQDRKENKFPFVARSVKTNNSLSKFTVNYQKENTGLSRVTLLNESSVYQKNLNSVLRSLQFIEDEEYLRNHSSFFKLRPHVVNSFVPQVLIHTSPCRRNGPFLLIAVPSVENHAARREAIRTTWGGLARGDPWPRTSGLSYDVRLIFFLGVLPKANMTSLAAESSRHGDIVMGNFLESYRNLTLKMGFVLHWCVTYCADVQHVLKIDEDTFLNTPLLLDLLHAVSRQHKRYIMGFRHTYLKPITVRYGRWGVDKTVYPFPYYPRYVYGHSYVISHDALRDLLTAYKYMPEVPSEDSHLTGILAKTMNISRIHCPYFAVLAKVDMCTLLERGSVSQTGLKRTADVLTMWSIIVKGYCQ